MGEAISNDMVTSFTKSFDNNCHKLNTVAPNTLRTPISLMRCSAINDAMPNKPRQLINMAKPAKQVASLPIRSSFSSFLA